MSSFPGILLWTSEVFFQARCVQGVYLYFFQISTLFRIHTYRCSTGQTISIIHSDTLSFSLSLCRSLSQTHTQILHVCNRIYAVIKKQPGTYIFISLVIVAYQQYQYYQYQSHINDIFFIITIILAWYEQTQIHFVNRVWTRSIGDCFQSLHPNGHRLLGHFENIGSALYMYVCM